MYPEYCLEIGDDYNRYRKFIGERFILLLTFDEGAGETVRPNLTGVNSCSCLFLTGLFVGSSALG